MKKEDAYRDKIGCYVAFNYDGHVFVLKTIKGAANGKNWTNPSYAFCPISSDTEFAVRFTTVEEAIVAVEKIWLKPIYTRHWEELEESFPGVDKLKWKEWHEYQEVLRHKAPLAAIAVGNKVYKDTYSTALSDGNAWVFAAGVERLFKYPVQATHKIDQLLLAIRQYPDMKLFDTVEERTEWSLKYLEEYAAIPEPAPVAKEQEVVSVGSIIEPMEAWTADKQTYCCVACNGVLYLPTWGKGNRCSFKNDFGYELQYADGSIITGQSTYRSLCKAVLDVKAQDTYVCYTQSREAYELFIKAHISKEKQQELLEELPGVDMTEQQEQELEVAPHTHTVTAVLPATAPPNSTTELPPVGLTNVPRNACIVHAFESQGTPKLRPVDIAGLPPGSVIEVDSYKSADIFMSTATDNTTPTATARLTTDGHGSSWDVVDNNGMPHGIDAARKFLTLVTASSDAQPIIETDGIKTMKPGVTPQPPRSRIGKIAARPYEYVYDGPQQMGTTFVSRYRIDDEVWVRAADELVKMKVTDIYVACKKGGVEYCYRLDNDKLTIHQRAEDKCYDTLFDLISAMTSISVEDLIAAAKEVE